MATPAPAPRGQAGTGVLHGCAALVADATAGAAAPPRALFDHCPTHRLPARRVEPLPRAGGNAWRSDEAVEHVFYWRRALGQPAAGRRRRGHVDRRRRVAAAPPGRSHADLRHAGLPRHDLLRGAGPFGAQPGAGRLTRAVLVDGEPLPRLLPRLPLLLRPQDP